MPQPSLDRPDVVPLVGERLTACVAQHVGMGLQHEPGVASGALDHPSEAGDGERRPDKGCRRAFALKPAQRPQLVARIGWGSVSRS
jgi:hypothetical protein